MTQVRLICWNFGAIIKITQRGIPLIIFIIIFSQRPIEAQKLHTVQSADGILVLEGRDSILFYRSSAKSLNGNYNRADYIHPLWGLNGDVLTLDFPEDHPQHRGVFWAWRQIKVDGKYAGDSWLCDDFSWDVKQIEVENASDTSLVIQTDVNWKSPRIRDRQGEQIPFVLEKVTIRVYKKQLQYRLIDMEIRLKALMKNVSIAGYDNESELGGFSIRMKTPNDLTFVSNSGELIPQWPAVEAGPWIDISGTLGSVGERSGIAILTNVNNPLPWNIWNLRKKNSMQNVVFPGKKAVVLPLDDIVVLKYRMMLYDGQSDFIRTDKLYKSFNE